MYYFFEQDETITAFSSCYFNTVLCQTSHCVHKPYLHNELSVTLLRLKSKSLVIIRITCRVKKACNHDSYLLIGGLLNLSQNM